jgi:hypothetical protein
MRREAVSGRALGLLAAAIACLGFAAPASAEQQAGADLHDARYCEILELKDPPPDARVVVWNTIGLNDCPAAKWDPLEAGLLAEELGDTAVVLNGPRHFLMDAAKARTGAVRSFHGLRMRRVATIPIHSFADLAQTTYTERTIDRDNTWHWRSGRRVYELLAPDGSTYVMQSYSQIVNPELTMADLSSLGDRLDPPTGWRYRVRRLKEPLTLRATGSATIIQDELKNTYQRMPLARESTRHRVDVSGVTRSVGSPQPGTIEDQGTITGRPFGRGSVDLVATLDNGRMTGPFTIDSKRGTAFGSVETTYVIEGNEITFDGTAEFTGGTGRYRGISGRRLKAHDHNTLDGQNGTLTLTGFARF